MNVLKIFIILLSVGSALATAETMKLVRGGTMISSFGKKSVTVADFYIDETFVTNQEYQEFVSVNPQWQKGGPIALFADQNYLKHWHGRAELGDRELSSAPVVNISWFAARAYCESKKARLPMVNEWEFLSQFGPKDVEGNVKDMILEWYSKPTPSKLPSVKSTFQNKFGVWDVHGLVWSWNEDFNTTFVTGESRGDAALEKSMFCGSGAMTATDAKDYASFMRFGFRSSLKANYTVGNLGFRCAKGASL